MSWESKDESELQPNFEDSLSSETKIGRGHCFSEKKEEIRTPYHSKGGQTVCRNRGQN